MVLDPNEGDESTIQPLPEDNDPPASGPDGATQTAPSEAETDIDSDEAYQYGKSAASEKGQQSDSPPGGYNPGADQRPKQD